MGNAEGQKSAEEIYKSLRDLFPEVVPVSFGEFMNSLEEAVRRAGEGQKLGQRTEYLRGNRLEFLTNLLIYWQVGKEIYGQIMRNAAGVEWDGWMSKYFIYQEGEMNLVDKIDSCKREFEGIFKGR